MEDALIWLRSLWLLWLVLLFVAIVAYVFWPKRRRRFERHARIPLEDDQVVRPSSRDGSRPQDREES